jgi:hypothetical protein
MKRKPIIGVLTAIAILLMWLAPAASAGADEGDRSDVGTLGSCIWDNVVTWDAGSNDNEALPGVPRNTIPNGDDAGADHTRVWYVTTNKCADINIALKSRPQPAQTIGVRACYDVLGQRCDGWKYWGPGYNGWLELNDQQPIPDNTRFYVEMYPLPHVEGYIAF